MRDLRPAEDEAAAVVPLQRPIRALQRLDCGKVDTAATPDPTPLVAPLGSRPPPLREDTKQDAGSIEDGQVATLKTEPRDASAGVGAS